jgi:hypothetical protein
MADTPFTDSYIESDAELEALIGVDPRAAAVALKALAAASQEWYCAEATRHIDQLPLRGTKYDIDVVAGVPDQPRAFPRIIDGVACDWNSSTSLAIVPTDIKRACMEEAIAIYAEQSAGGTSRASLQEAGVASYQIPGIISETFRPGGGSTAQMGLKSSNSYRILAKYIARSVPIR